MVYLTIAIQLYTIIICNKEITIIKSIDFGENVGKWCIHPTIVIRFRNTSGR